MLTVGLPSRSFTPRCLSAPAYLLGAQRAPKSVSVSSYTVHRVPNTHAFPSHPRQRVYISPFRARSMASQAAAPASRQDSEQAADPAVDKVLDFWFNPADLMRWFGPSEKMDDTIRSHFSDLITRARETVELESGSTDWTETAQGTLALLLLLDQFPRNIYRGSGLSYAADGKAREVATRAVAREFDRQLDLIQQPFFYLPFMHDETLLGQIAGRELYRGFLRRCDATPEDPMVTDFAGKSIDMAEKHMEVILMFGRFPSRNRVLGRKSTDEEEAFLKENPSGF